MVKIKSKLKQNDRAEFKAYNGKIIIGTVYIVTNNCYIVISDTQNCATYYDGMYRFTDRHLIRKIEK